MAVCENCSYIFKKVALRLSKWYNISMKAWKIINQGEAILDELPSQKVAEGQVKVKLTRSALSWIDIAKYDGKVDPSNVIIGSQGVGMVTEVHESVTNFERGDRVFLGSYNTCDVCPSCKSNKVDECSKLERYGIDSDGYLRDFAVVNADVIYKLPERIVDDEAILIQRITMASNIISKLSLQKGEHIVIVGADVLGLILAQVAIYHQAVPIIIDSHKSNLQIAESLGAYYFINSVEEDVNKKVKTITGGRMAETVCHIVGNHGVLARSLEYCADNGRVVVAGCDINSSELNSAFKTVLKKQLTVTGVNNGAKSITGAINMLVNNAVKVSPLVTKCIEFNEVADTIKECSEDPQRYLKVVVKI